MPENDQPLSDLRVLDCSQGVAGPFCAKLLCGLGAEVIKIEGPAPSRTSSFQYLNTGKKGITLNFDSSRGAALLVELALDSDVLVESFSPGYMDGLGVGYSSLEALNPRLIYTSITPFGQTGPYRDYRGSDIVAQAMGALMFTIGLPDKEPLKIGANAALYTVGMSAFSATTLAIYQRDIYGHGQHVDISAMESQAVAQIHSTIHYQFGRVPARKEGSLVLAMDGWVSPGLEVGVQEDTWARVCDLMGTPHLTNDPSFGTKEARRENQKELLAIFGEWAAAKPKEEIYHTLQKLRTIAGYVASVEDLLHSEHLQARGFFQPIRDPEAGDVMHPGALFTVDGQPWGQVPAPRQGEHNEEILCGRLGYSPEDIETMRQQGAI